MRMENPQPTISNSIKVEIEVQRVGIKKLK